MLVTGALALARFSREWRNRQTRTVQVRVSERTWGFNSPLAHQTNMGSHPLPKGRTGPLSGPSLVVSSTVSGAPCVLL